MSSLRFLSIHNPRWFAVVHPSTNEPGRWQVSYFDERGAVSDTRRDTRDEAIRAIEPGFVLDDEEMGP